LCESTELQRKLPSFKALASSPPSQHPRHDSKRVSLSYPYNIITYMRGRDATARLLSAPMVFASAGFRCLCWARAPRVPWQITGRGSQVYGLQRQRRKCATSRRQIGKPIGLCVGQGSLIGCEPHVVWSQLLQPCQPTSHGYIHQMWTSTRQTALF
jgi:hypothetical protein